MTAAHVKALERLIKVIDQAGLINLSMGVQLGQTAWYIKASDALDAARAALREPVAEAPAAVPLSDEQINRLAQAQWGYVSSDHSRIYKFARAIEAAHNIHQPSAKRAT